MSFFEGKGDPKIPDTPKIPKPTPRVPITKRVPITDEEKRINGKITPRPPLPSAEQGWLGRLFRRRKPDMIQH